MRREGDFQGEFPIYRDGLASGPIYHPLGQLQLPHHLVSTPERNATSSEANFQLIREWVETIWNEAQCDQLPRFHPPFFDNHGKPTAIEETRQWHVRMRATYPDLHYTIDDIFTVGDRVALRWTARGTQRGSLWGMIPAADKAVTWSVIHLLRLADDQIVEVYAVADTTAVLQQLGVKLLLPDEGSA